MQVAIIGTGLIGGSIGMALRAQGHTVVGFDTDPEVRDLAVAAGACDVSVASLEAAIDGCEAAVVAVPVGVSADLIVAALRAGAPAVTDTGSVKAQIVDAVYEAEPELASRFIGTHPMAGSEQGSIRGARADLFGGAVWIMTPQADTDPDAFAVIQHVITECGAESIAVSPARHDQCVAFVSHVPQLAATTLMSVAARAGTDDQVLLRLAAGGFRDMTRIAASNPLIWPDICIENRTAILEALDAYQRQLELARTLVAEADRDGLYALMSSARAARQNLPRGFAVEGPVAEIRIPVPDRPGVLAEVTTIAGELGINIGDIEIAHSIEGKQGVLVVVVASVQAGGLVGALLERGYRPSVAELDA